MKSKSHGHKFSVNNKMLNPNFNEVWKTQTKSNWQITVNGQECKCNKSIAVQISPLIKKYTHTEGNVNISEFITDIPNLPSDSLMHIGTNITKIFKGNAINFNENNVEALSLIGKHFEIDDLIKKSEKYLIYKEDITIFLKNDPEIQEIKILEKLLLLEMNEVNFEKIIYSCLFFSSKIPLNCIISFISKVCLKNIKNKNLEPNLLLINVMKRLERYIPGTIRLFVKITFEQFLHLNRKGNPEIDQRGEINSLVSQIFNEIAEVVLRDEINIKIKGDDIDIPTCLKKYFEGDDKSIKNYKKNNRFQENFALFLQKDEIDSFQKYIVNQEINVNYHFRKDPNNVNIKMNYKQSCSLIEYSALFGSINCFRFLYNSKAQINKEILGNYAIAGGNTEIIHICEHENCFFNEETLHISIKFHQHKLTKWLVETKRVPINVFHLKSSISNYNIYSMIYLITKGIDISSILLYSAENNNIIVFKWIFLSKILKKFPKYIGNFKNKIKLLHIACEQNNVEIVKLLLTKGNIDINSIYEV